MLRYMTRPLSDRMWLRPAGQRRRSQFTASWTSTLDLLEREIDMLRGRDVIMEIDVAESQIRNDGMVKAGSRIDCPAVVIAFESKHGPLLYRCDVYNAVAWQARSQEPWQANVRAIAMTLEALRAVERYGASETGEQYRGYKALPSGSGEAASHMTKDEAVRIIGDLVGVGLGWVLTPDRDKIMRVAKAKAHPDANGGDRKIWDLVEVACRLLEPKQVTGG